MLDSKLLAAILVRFGDTATPIIQMGSSTDRYDITGLQFEHYPNDKDYMVLVAGSNNLQDRDTPDESVTVRGDKSVPLVPREYLLQTLVYEVLERYGRELPRLASLPKPFYVYYSEFFGRYPDAKLTSGEIDEVFLEAIRQQKSKVREAGPKAAFSKTLAELESTYHKYLLDLLPYQLVHIMSDDDIRRGAMDSSSHELFQPVWDEYPYIELTEDEIQGAFQGAVALLK